MAEKDEVREHSFDGIQEYDNDLPRWWVNIFLITAIYSIGYIAYMHLGFRDSDAVQLAKSLAELEAMQKSSQPVETASSSATTSPADTILTLTSNSEALATAKKNFDSKCAACHRTDAGGLVGPNLTDDYWIHGGTITDIKKVITEGVPAKGMVAWKGLMTPSEIDGVVAYIWTLKGSNPENPKAPQGDMIGQPQESASDVTKEAESSNDQTVAQLEEGSPEKETREQSKEGNE